MGMGTNGTVLYPPKPPFALAYLILSYVIRIKNISMVTCRGIVPLRIHL